MRKEIPCKGPHCIKTQELKFPDKFRLIEGLFEENRPTYNKRTKSNKILIITWAMSALDEINQCTIFIKTSFIYVIVNFTDFIVTAFKFMRINFQDIKISMKLNLTHLILSYNGKYWMYTKQLNIYYLGKIITQWHRFFFHN